MIAPFKLRDDGWHEETKRHYLYHMETLVTEESERGSQYRRKFLGMPPEEHTRLLRSLPMAKQCKHNTGQIGFKPCCGGCAYYGCKIKGEVRLPDCANCTDWQRVPSEPGKFSEPIRLDHFNLHPGIIPGVRFNSSIIESV